MESISFDPRSINNLLDQLKNQTGIEFNCYRRNFLERRIKSRMIRLGLNTDKSYLDYILTNPQEIDLFLERFTINYSYFFRNIEIFNKLCEIIFACKNEKFQIPSVNYEYITDLSIFDKIRRSYAYKESGLKIWSCPCASGEEPYSLVMVLEQIKEEIGEFPNYEITASDIDKNIIKIARTGIYGAESLKETPHNYISTYFTKFDDRLGPKFLINNDIKRKVEFIIEDVTRGHNKDQKYDIIFCRYLLIYINRDFRENLLRIIENHLAPGGLLVLGKTETLLNSKLSFKLLDGKNHFYIKM
ncbi:MAG: protein-glutamate O-methyltransferase CheR [Promethearchaeota archaeon]|nr:MAG: protein-glutamate O-methyltransferase CheR [Candidatus Lokiarchaeota archaeon]